MPGECQARTEVDHVLFGDAGMDELLGECRPKPIERISAEIGADEDDTADRAGLPRVHRSTPP